MTDFYFLVNYPNRLKHKNNVIPEFNWARVTNFNFSGTIVCIHALSLVSLATYVESHCDWTEKSNLTRVSYVLWGSADLESESQWLWLCLKCCSTPSDIVIIIITTLVLCPLLHFFYSPPHFSIIHGDPKWKVNKPVTATLIKISTGCETRTHTRRKSL